MIFPAGSAGHETVAEINQAPQGDERKEDSLFQADRVRSSRLFFYETAFANMGAGTELGPVKKERLPERPAFQPHISSESAIYQRDRAFFTQTGSGAQGCVCPRDTHLPVEHHVVARNPLENHVVINIHHQGVANINSPVHKLLYFCRYAVVHFHLFPVRAIKVPTLRALPRHLP